MQPVDTWLNRADVGLGCVAQCFVGDDLCQLLELVVTLFEGSEPRLSVRSSFCLWGGSAPGGPHHLMRVGVSEKEMGANAMGHVGWCFMYILSCRWSSS